MSGAVKIHLNDDEALVLSDLLCRWFDEPDHALPNTVFKHDAERAVLEMVLGGQLDKQAASVFSPDYVELVDQARQRISERYPPISD